jgi:Ca2+-binding EF-hand superfamily protein
VKLAEQYSSFMVTVDEDEVMWWTGLNEVPADVLLFLQFCICGGYPNASKVFAKMECHGNGIITLVQFSEALQGMGCKKFEGPTEAERVKGVFRYLDPGGEGCVSAQRFAIIQQLWDEFELSVKEFVQFLCRIFGEDLDVSWLYLMEVAGMEEDGEIDLEQWLVAVRKINDFGPAQPVFFLLDASEDGNISVDEFRVLDK